MENNEFLKQAEMAKLADELVSHLAADDLGQFKQAYEAYGEDIIRTIVREGSIVEQILPVVNCDMNHPNIHPEKTTDEFYYMEDVETDAVALETSFRAGSKPTFITSNKYTVNVGKLKSEKIRKPQIELMAAPRIMNMIKQNSANKIIRAQDGLFMAGVKTAVEYASWSSGDHYLTADWTTGANKIDIINLMNLISEQELVPKTFLMSNSCWNFILSEEGTNFGADAGERLYGGHKVKELFSIPVITTVKEGLSRGSDEYFMSTTTDSAGTDKYYYIYCFVDPRFLGKVIKVGKDNVWSRWDEDIFEWSSWRYVGMGFGDSRGIVRLRVLVTT